MANIGNEYKPVRPPSAGIFQSAAAGCRDGRAQRESTTVSEITGEGIKTILEDIGDNLFNPDPYYQQGGDMVRVGGLQYRCDPIATMGRRISDMRLRGKPIAPDKKYKVAGWAPVSEEAKQAGGEAIWDVIARYLRQQKIVKPRMPNVPTLKGVSGNSGIA